MMLATNANVVGHPHDGHQQQLLDPEADRPHHRVERPAEVVFVVPGLARTLDEPLELAHRDVRVKLAVVDEGTQLFLDHAQQLDAPERVETEIGLQA